MKWKFIFLITGVGIFTIVITPLIASLIRQGYQIPSPDTCLGCNELEGWLRFNYIFIPGIIIIGIGIYYILRKMKSS